MRDVLVKLVSTNLGVIMRSLEARKVFKSADFPYKIKTLILTREDNMIIHNHGNYILRYYTKYCETNINF